ncbi:MAG: anhydro-N-acetylmuramic acid kinase [Limnochordia bacterium]|jgi:anhydro-N-acetylmuramic acid kinase
MERLAVGLMSGTSVDGIDAALVRLNLDSPLGFSLEEFITIPYTAEERAAILSLCEPGRASVSEICAMNFRLGELFASAVLELLRKAGISPEKVEVIGSHGQTIWHIPGEATLQIGEPAVIANRTGILTVADFRPADIAVGGQGAPLVPYLDEILFGTSRETTAVQNIGGIGNVTVVGGNADQVPWIAFDTGPGNMIIDAVMSAITGGAARFDQDGEMAAKGQVQESLLQELMRHPYFEEKPPKSTGRELFGREFSERLLQESRCSPEDLVATVTAFTAESIADQYRRFVLPFTETIDRVVVAGGGSRNPTLLRMIQERVGCPVYVHDDFGISSDAKEAVAFALMAVAAVERRANNVPRATGAHRRTVLGKIVYPGEA